jgi:hypothetical protein
MSSKSFVARAGSQARGHALLLACSLLLSACGGSTTTPAPTLLSLAGAWTGTWTFVSGGATVSDTVTLTLTQNPSGGSVGGQWSAAGGAGGTVSFPATADFTGTATISQTPLTGGNCSASTTITGTASAS